MILNTIQIIYFLIARDIHYPLTHQLLTHHPPWPTKPTQSPLNLIFFHLMTLYTIQTIYDLIAHDTHHPSTIYLKVSYIKTQNTHCFRFLPNMILPKKQLFIYPCAHYINRGMHSLQIWFCGLLEVKTTLYWGIDMVAVLISYYGEAETIQVRHLYQNM